MSLSILYVGDDAPHTTSMHRADALRRLGHRVQIVDPEPPSADRRLWAAVHYRTGYRFLQRATERRVLAATGADDFDVAWVNGGRSVGPALVRTLKRRSALVVNYNNDDPFGPLGRHWAVFRAAVPEYDLLAVVRPPNVEEAYAAGAKRVERVFMSYDDEAHRPRDVTPEERERRRSDVVFVGHWMPERGPFMAELMERGIPLTIFGGRWQKAVEWPLLRTAWKGGHLEGDDYALALQCAHVALGLLARQNRDMHTQRSLEVPALGGLLCAERTPEHQELFVEGEEAVFWSDAAECAERCWALLEDPGRRDAIAAAGHERVSQDGRSNEAVVAHILDTAIATVTR